ncbi:hypothetical protein NMG60_11008124 [Bertholletia excelsa]
MACLDMYSSSSSAQNSDRNKSLSCAPVSPRISFSNDFVDSAHNHHHHHQNIVKSSGEAPASSDFEFSVTGYSMMTADELFFKGRLLPYRDNNRLQKPTTLREELMAGDDDDGGFSLRPPKGSGSTRWKDILGLRKSHIGSRKPTKPDGSSAGKRQSLGFGSEGHSSKSSLEMEEDGESSCRDSEFGM